MRESFKKSFSIFLMLLLVTVTFSCGSTTTAVLSISECEAEGGNVVLSSSQQAASCDEGQISIGPVQTFNLTGTCCKPKPP